MISWLVKRLLSRADQLSSRVASHSTARAESEDALVEFAQAIDAGDLARAHNAEATLLAKAHRSAHFSILRGRLCWANNDLTTAQMHLQEAVSNSPDVGEGHAWLAAVLALRNRNNEALKEAKEAIDRGVAFAWLYVLLGAIHFQRNEISEAIVHFESALQIDPENADALGNLVVANARLENWAEVARYGELSTQLKPESSKAWASFGTGLIGTGDWERAWVAFDRAQAKSDVSPSIFQDHAAALFNAGRVQESLEILNKGLLLDPNHTQMHVARASCKLILEGSTEEAWSEYEWRRKLDAENFEPRSKLWDGRPLGPDEPLLIYMEQGFGDIFLFARFIQIASSRAASIKLAAPTSMDTLLRASAASNGWNNVVVVPANKKPSPEHVAYEYEVPLLSLPLVLGTFEALNDKPYLHPPAVETERWKKWLGPKTTRARRVGLVWAGNPRRFDIEDRLRSIPTRELASLGRLENIEFFSLQMDARPKYKQVPLPLNHRDPTGEIRSFADTAAVISQLDLVLSIDTAVAHLAGALSVPCWVMLSCIRDWRWEMGERSQPWYGKSRTFRSDHPFQWEKLLEQIVDELNEDKSMAG